MEQLASWKQQTDSGTTDTLWNYAYDNVDQLLSGTKTNFSTGAILSKYVYGYDLAGNRTSLQNGTSVTQTSYNNLNQIQTASAGGPMQFSGTLNEPVKQVTVKANSGPANLAQIEGSTNFIGYASVTAGSTNSVAVAATDYSNHAVTNSYQVVVPASASTGPTFDANGSMTYNGNSGSAQNYTWDAKGRLASITYSGGSTTAFTYDGLGRRVAMVEWPGAVGTGTPTSTKDFVWVGLRFVEERSSSTTVTKRFYEQGEQISGTSYYYTRDHLGSVRELTTASGTVEARYDYDPYGRTTLLSGTNLSDFQYAGYYVHEPSGLNLTLYRAYDPTTARWLSRDPVEELGGINLYGYVGNNPLSVVDLFGLSGTQTNVTATVFSTQNDPDNNGQNPAYTPNTPINDTTTQGAALPSGGLQGQYVQITNPTSGATVTVPVIDIGPGSVNDPYWNNGSGSASNQKSGAGIDLTPATAAALGIPTAVASTRQGPTWVTVGPTPKVDWKFVPGPESPQRGPLRPTPRQTTKGCR